VSGLDVGKLLVGSRGTLAVLTEVTCRLRPLPASRAVWVGRCGTAEAAWTLCRGLPAWEPAAEALVSTEEGCAWVVVLEGAPREVEADLARLRAHAEARVAHAVFRTGPAEAPPPEVLPDAAPAWDPVGPGHACALRCEVPEARLEAAWREACRASEGAVGLRWTAWLGVGTLWVAVASPPPQLSADAWCLAVRAAAEAEGGRAVVVQAPAEAEVSRWGDPGPLGPWFRRVKAVFDPDGILAPGRFVGD
jgi:glycolate oxidase FAD binding subunit